MTVNLNVIDHNGDHITTFSLYDDVYEHLATEAAINGVDVADHIAEIVTGHAHDIINSLRGDDTLPNHCDKCGSWGTTPVHLVGCPRWGDT